MNSLNVFDPSLFKKLTVKVSKWIVDLLDGTEETKIMTEGLRRFWNSKTLGSLVDVLAMELRIPNEFWAGFQKGFGPPNVMAIDRCK